jgi:hypothetical protein
MAHDLALSLPHDDLNQIERPVEVIFDIAGAHQSNTNGKSFS